MTYKGVHRRRDDDVIGRVALGFLAALSAVLLLAVHLTPVDQGYRVVVDAGVALILLTVAVVSRRSAKG